MAKVKFRKTAVEPSSVMSQKIEVCKTSILSIGFIGDKAEIMSGRPPGEFAGHIGGMVEHGGSLYKFKARKSGELRNFRKLFDFLKKSTISYRLLIVALQRKD